MKNNKVKVEIFKGTLTLDLIWNMATGQVLHVPADTSEIARTRAGDCNSASRLSEKGFKWSVSNATRSLGYVNITRIA